MKDVLGDWHLQVLYILARSATRVGISFFFGLKRFRLTMSLSQKMKCPLTSKFQTSIIDIRTRLKSAVNSITTAFSRVGVLEFQSTHFFYAFGD